MIRALAVATSAATALVGAGLDPSPESMLMAALYLGAGMAGLGWPLGVTAQIGAGQLWAAGLVVSGGTTPTQVVPLVVGVVLNAELLGLHWMNAGSLERERPVGWTGLARPTLMAAGAYAVVLGAGSLPGPSGLAAVALASAAAAGAALAMVIRKQPPEGGGSP